MDGNIVACGEATRFAIFQTRREVSAMGGGCLARSGLVDGGEGDSFW
jgi:hypothetical protein